MLDEKIQKEILQSISLTGSADAKNAIVRPIINGNMNHVLSLSSGKPRFQTNVIKRFSQIVTQPEALAAMSRYEIRCCLCKHVISYPCWYYSIKYAVNHFHYFVCYDLQSIDKPSTRCYRR